MSDLAKVTGASPEVKLIIKQLKNKELNVNDVPEELALEPNIIRTERKMGIRIIGHRGFDVIMQKFFVEEKLFCYSYLGKPFWREKESTFDTFAEYYYFLDGDIYENACYYQYAFEDEFSKSLKLDMSRLTALKSFVIENVDDYSYELSEEEITEYNDCEKNKKLVKQWMEKFNACNTYEQFQKVCNNYEKSKVKQYVNIKFFFFQYALNVQHRKEHLDVLMEYMSKDYYNNDVVMGLCLIYTPDIVLGKYNYSQASKRTNEKRKKELKEFIEKLKRQEVETYVEGYFDTKSHFFCEKTEVHCYLNDHGKADWYRTKLCRAFETFEDFIKYRNGDLRHCDLSGAIDLDIDFSKYIIDDSTKIPIGKNSNLNYKVKKIYTKGEFRVGQFWYNEYDKCIKKYIHTFHYFFDFVAFLKGDLSDANLIFCTGMKNLPDIDGINLSNARMTSELCEQFNVAYTSYDYDKSLISEFPVVEKNEKETTLVLQTSTELDLSDDEQEEKYNSISYISDLHLMHRIKNAKCKSKEDVVYIMQKIINTISDESTEIILIGGDVSSNFLIFELFVKMLKRSLDKLYTKRDFIFVLGNHEFWDFPELSVEQIVKKYREVLRKNGMYLLHNDLLYKNEWDDIEIVPYDALLQLNNSDISKKLRRARLTILGGLGFSGYNEEFNANDGVYRETVDRNTEIKESKKFEQLYNKLTDVLAKKNTVIFTHTPKKDWCEDLNYHDKFVYVSGHTHRNMFFDDGVERVYADNQIGYKNGSIHLKRFLMDGKYDYFADYRDGIYEITSQEYQDFSRGKNIQMTFNRKVNVLYMLKKNEYYCFIHKTNRGTLSILNGGALKTLNKNDVQYYYNNMDKMISLIETPLREYTTYQERIADEIKKIGGSGRIHGCIIDIDYHNHIYVNPTDMTVTSYWASDIINKLVYPDMLSLLNDKCHELYNNYMKLIESEKLDIFKMNQTKAEVSFLPERYLETDIYRASREIKKMQKLKYNVLTTWYDSDFNEDRLIGRSCENYNNEQIVNH